MPSLLASLFPTPRCLAFCSQSWLRALLAAHWEAVQAAAAAADAWQQQHGAPAELSGDGPAALDLQKMRLNLAAILCRTAARCPQLVGAPLLSLLHCVLLDLPMVRAALCCLGRVFEQAAAPPSHARPSPNSRRHMRNRLLLNCPVYLQATLGERTVKVEQYRLLADTAAQQPRLAAGLAASGVLDCIFDDAQTLAEDRLAAGLLVRLQLGGWYAKVEGGGLPAHGCCVAPPALAVQPESAALPCMHCRLRNALKPSDVQWEL